MYSETRSIAAAEPPRNSKVARMQAFHGGTPKNAKMQRLCILTENTGVSDPCKSSGEN